MRLDTGTVVMRRLKCGLLFVCVGPQIEKPQPDEGAEVGEEGSEERDEEVSAEEQQQSGDDQEAVAAMKLRMRELVRSLDDKLGTLTVPVEAVGGE